jgi:hypothetical protein
MNQRLTRLALCATFAGVLAACGGGSDDPQPTERNTLVNVSEASPSSLNGVYGSSETSLSPVDKVYEVGSSPRCDFTFDNVVKVGDSASRVKGRINYKEDTLQLDQITMTFGSEGYVLEGAGAGTSVDKPGNRVTFNDKVLRSVNAGSTATVKVTGYIPMQGNRPDGC